MFSVLLFLSQLYDLGEETERKEFLDKLFAFMQHRGMYGYIYFYIPIDFRREVSFRFANVVRFEMFLSTTRHHPLTIT